MPHGGAKLPARLMHAGCDGAYGNGKQVRDLLIRVSIHNGKDESGAKSGRQGLDRLTQQRRLLPSGQILGDPAAADRYDGQFIKWPAPPRSLPSQPIANAVGQDAVKPCRDQHPPIEVVPLAKGLAQCFLCQVRRVVEVSRHAQRGTIEPRIPLAELMVCGSSHAAASCPAPVDLTTAPSRRHYMLNAPRVPEFDGIRKFPPVCVLPTETGCPPARPSPPAQPPYADQQQHGEPRNKYLGQQSLLLLRTGVDLHTVIQ